MTLPQEYPHTLGRMLERDVKARCPRFDGIGMLLLQFDIIDEGTTSLPIHVSTELRLRLRSTLSSIRMYCYAASQGRYHR
jgi:hypothetical protein